MDVNINMGKTQPSRSMQVGGAMIEMIQSSMGDRQEHPDFCEWREKGEIISWKDLGKL